MSISVALSGFARSPAKFHNLFYRKQSAPSFDIIGACAGLSPEWAAQLIDCLGQIFYRPV